MERFIFNFFNKTKGVVSAFLVIILVPIVTACSLFVDASRIKLAKSVIQSSGDLALDTVLSNFDADLAEIYGLMASCQNTSEVKAAAVQYFQDSMISTGLAPEYADRYSNMIAGFVGGESFDVVHDLLGISAEDPKISAVKNANLANPAIVESQIIEFMKYRAPVEAVSELIDIFKNIKDQAENAKKETQMTSDMSDYYEAKKDVMGNLEMAYHRICQYNKLKITKQYLEDIKKELSSPAQNTNDKSIGKTYKEFHDEMVLNLFTFIEYDTPNYSDKKLYKPSEINAKEINNMKTALSSNNYKTKMEGLQRTIQNYFSAVNQFNTKYNATKYDGSYRPQYWIQTYQNIKGSPIDQMVKYCGNGSNSMSYQLAYLKKSASIDTDANLDTKIILPVIEGVDASGEKTIREHMVSFESQINRIYSTSASGSDADKNIHNYMQMGPRLTGISNNYYGAFIQKKGEIDDKANEIKKRLDAYIKQLNLAIKLLSENIDEFHGANFYLKKAREQLSTMNASYEAWTNDLSDTKFVNTSETAKKIKEGAYKDEKEFIDSNKVNYTTIDQLINRCSGIASLCGNVKKAINDLKYGNKKVVDITNCGEVKNASGISKNKITLIESELRTYSGKSFNFHYPNLNPCTVTNNNHPEFSVNKPTLLTWMEGQFKTPEEEEARKEKRQQEEQNYKDEEKKKKNSATSKDEESDKASKLSVTDKSDLPSSGSSGDDGGKVTDDVKAIATYVVDLFKNFDLSQPRDDLYLLCYIMNMFSYDTFDKEIRYNAQYSDKGEEGDYDRMTLTNIKIDIDHNYSYLNEVEYILYGNSSISKNKKASYGTIFALRYALNLVYALGHFWGWEYDTGRTINITAEGIATATSGIIPAPLTKIIMILGLVALESSKDIVYLKKGNPVSLFKEDKNWYAQIAFKSESAYDRDNLSSIAFSYSDYLKLILFLKIIANRDAIVLRTADVIQANMDLATGNGDKYRMKKCITHFKLTAKCESSILMLALPVVESEMNENNYSIGKWNEYNVTLYRGY